MAVVQVRNLETICLLSSSLGSGGSRRPRWRYFSLPMGWAGVCAPSVLSQKVRCQASMMHARQPRPYFDRRRASGTDFWLQLSVKARLWPLFRLEMLKPSVFFPICSEVVAAGVRGGGISLGQWDGLGCARQASHPLRSAAEREGNNLKTFA